MLNKAKCVTLGEWEFYPLGLTSLLLFEIAFLGWCEHSPF